MVLVFRWDEVPRLSSYTVVGSRHMTQRSMKTSLRQASLLNPALRSLHHDEKGMYTNLHMQFPSQQHLTAL